MRRFTREQAEPTSPAPNPPEPCPRNHKSPASRTREFRRGITAALTLLLGVIPFGVIYGTLAIASGFSPLAVMAMSATVYSGAAQMLAVGLYATQTPPLAIVLATFIISLRHLLYGVILGQYYRGISRARLAILAFTTIDELFVLVQSRVQHSTLATDITRPESRHGTTDWAGNPPPNLHWFALGASSVLYAGWQIATYLGVAGGRLIQDPTALGLEFALPATFIAFLVPQLRTRPIIVCALTAGASALLLQALPLQTGLIVSILLGVAAAVWVDKRREDELQPEAEKSLRETNDP